MLTFAPEALNRGHHGDAREQGLFLKDAVIFLCFPPPRGVRTRACELGPTIASRYASEP